MDTTKLTSLERAVYGTNLINKLTIENVNKIIPQLQQFLNKKVELANGSNAKNFVIELHKFSNDNGQNLRSYLHFDYNGLNLKNDVTVKVKNYEGGGYGVDYYKNEIKLATTDNNGVLISIENLEQIIFSYELSKVFDAKEVKETKDKIEQLKNELSKLERSIYQFKNIY